MPIFCLTIWGKSTNVTSEHLSGPPPEIFMVNCRTTIQEENVKEHFSSLKVDVLEVKKKSHENARKNSFVITPATREDYDKIMSGDYLPRDVGVRQFFRRRYQATEASKAVTDFLQSSPGGVLNTFNSFTDSRQSGTSEPQNGSAATLNQQNGGRG